MNSQNGKAADLSQTFDRVLMLFSHLTIKPVEETVAGVRLKTIPVMNCLLLSVTFQIFFIFNLDSLLFNYITYGLYQKIPSTLWLLIPKFTFSLFFGFWAWGVVQVTRGVRLRLKLKEIFLSTGLKSLTGKLPSFIFDHPIDQSTRKLRISRNGFPLKRFHDARPSLESSMQVFIDEIKESRISGTVDIVYAHSELEKLFSVKDLTTIQSDKFLVGKSRSKTVQSSFDEIPHLLIAGQTGGGKSTMLRSLITYTYLNNPKYEFFLIDLKGGLEFQIFDGRPRIKVVADAENAHFILERIVEKQLKSRMELLKRNQCKDISTFLTDLETRKFDSEQDKKSFAHRQIIVIDEAFELFMANPNKEKDFSAKTRAFANKIAAQGRALGIHLWIATQRPDRFAIDPLTKANLTGKICFRLSNLASSMTVLDDSRATEIPNIPGRAIYQSSSEFETIQTPYLSVEKATVLLETANKPPQAETKSAVNNGQQ